MVEDANDTLTLRAGAASLDLPNDASSRVRARARLADELVAEAQALLDAPLDAYAPGPDATRAKNRADFRWKRAAAYARATYGEAPPTVAVQVNTNVDLGAILPSRPIQPDMAEPVPP